MFGFAGVSREHVTGFVVGVGIAAAGYYLYMKNKDKVDETLSEYGIRIPGPEQQDMSKLTLEELMLKKETIEDLIAEKEMELQQSGLPQGESPDPA